MRLSRTVYPKVIYVLAAAATLAVALSLPSAFTGIPRVAADEGHSGLDFLIISSGNLSGCNSVVPESEKCEVRVGRTFTVGVMLENGGGVAYDALQFAIEYSGVISKGNPSVTWPDCDIPAIPDPQPANRVIAACTATSSSSFTGSIGEADFNCSAEASANNVITLLHGTGDEGTWLRDAQGQARHSEASGGESVLVNCVEVLTADMNLNLKGPGTSCDQPSNPTKCLAPVGSPFTLAVETKNPPAAGIESFVTDVRYEGLLYKPVPDDEFTTPNEGAQAEVVWPGATIAIRSPGTPSGTEGSVVHAAGGGQEDFVGNLVELSMNCEQEGTATVRLPADDDPTDPGSASFTDLNGEQVFLNSSDSLEINCFVPGVGGVAELPRVDATALETPGSSDRSVAPLAAIAAASVAGFAAVGAGAWRARKWWLR